MSTRGFTFFEVLIVMGIFALVGGSALFVSMETYQGSNFRSDRDLLVALLQRARAQAMNNVCLGTCTDGKPHGVHIDPDAYVVFQDNGSGYNSGDPLNASFNASQSITHSGATNIIFARLSGETTAATITLTGAGQTSLISIGPEGQITWTN